MELLSVAVLGGKYINEKIQQNDTYYGTSKTYLEIIQEYKRKELDFVD